MPMACKYKYNGMIFAFTDMNFIVLDNFLDSTHKFLFLKYSIMNYLFF